MAWSCCGPGVAQLLTLPAASTEQPVEPIAALSERLAAQLRAAGKSKPYILDLSLPNDEPCPLGAWLADRLSEALAQVHPELEVISRDRWSSTRGPTEFAHDRNQEFAQNEQRARSLGAEVLIHGNLAAIPGGIGITLLVSDRLTGGHSRWEALAELPITSAMQAVLSTPLPRRTEQQGGFRAGTAGIGSPRCQVCPAPEYTYVAKAKKLQGVVIAQIRVNTKGGVENIKIVRTPNPALAEAAVRTVRNWRFTPAHNAQGAFVPVIVDVAVAFRLDGQLSAAGSAAPPNSRDANDASAADKMAENNF